MQEEREKRRIALEKLEKIRNNRGWCKTFEDEAKRILTGSLEQLREDFYSSITPSIHLSSIIAFPKTSKEEIEKLESNNGPYTAAQKLLDKVFCYDEAIFQLLKSMVKQNQLFYVEELFGKIRESSPNITPLNEMSENSLAQPADWVRMNYTSAGHSESAPPFSASVIADRRNREESANSVSHSVDRSMRVQPPSGDLSIFQSADRELVRLRAENEQMRNYISSMEGGLESYHSSFMAP